MEAAKKQNWRDTSAIQFMEDGTCHYLDNLKTTVAYGEGSGSDGRTGICFIIEEKGFP